MNNLFENNANVVEAIDAPCTTVDQQPNISAEQHSGTPSYQTSECCCSVVCCSAEQQPAEQQPAEQQPAEQQPAEQQPAEQQPAEQQPAEQQPAEQQPAEQQPAEQQPAEQPPSESVARPTTLTLNGERPFAGAVALYNEAMQKAIDREVAMLDAHPEWQSRRVMVNLFDQFQVPCRDIPDGKESVRKFYAHSVHYGPQSNIAPFVGEDPEKFRIRAFCTRDASIWTRMAPRDADGKTVQAYPPFRKLQMELATRRKLFLLDHSYHFRKPDGTIRYYQHMTIVRKLTTPIPLWHEYGLLPCAWKFK